MSNDSEGTGGPFLYHVVPRDMRGGVLYPLGRLRERWPDLAVAAARKYDGRESLMDVLIPILGCRWNDAIHLAPLHPAKTRQALADAGLSPGALDFFAIPAEMLGEGRAVFFKNSVDTCGMYDFRAEDFSVFDAARFRGLADAPEAQKEAFRSAAARGGRPLLWSRTPHVFYQGEIRTSSLRRFSWEERP